MRYIMLQCLKIRPWELVHKVILALHHVAMHEKYQSIAIQAKIHTDDEDNADALNKDSPYVFLQKGNVFNPQPDRDGVNIQKSDGSKAVLLVLKNLWWTLESTRSLVEMNSTCGPLMCCSTTYNQPLHHEVSRPRHHSHTLVIDVWQQGTSWLGSLHFWAQIWEMIFWRLLSLRNKY